MPSIQCCSNLLAHFNGCCGITLILPAGPRSSFLQLVGVLADDDFPRSPFPGIALSQNSHHTYGHTTSLLPRAACIPPWIWGYKYPSPCTQKGHISPETLAGLAENFVETSSPLNNSLCSIPLPSLPFPTLTPGC